MAKRSFITIQSLHSKVFLRKTDDKHLDKTLDIKWLQSVVEDWNSISLSGLPCYGASVKESGREWGLKLTHSLGKSNKGASHKPMKE